MANEKKERDEHDLSCEDCGDNVDNIIAFGVWLCSGCIDKRIQKLKERYIKAIHQLQICPSCRDCDSVGCKTCDIPKMEKEGLLKLPPKKFNENTLYADIVKKWGEVGAHADVFRELCKRAGAKLSE